MRKICKGIAVMLTAVLLTTSATACNRVVEKVDTGKTQIYVSNYDGGVGHSWLDDVKTRFEAKYAEYSFEENKKGVQIMITNHKNAGIMDTLSAAPQEVFFMQSVVYNNSTKDMVDISDIVTQKEIPDESGKKIEDKLYDNTKAFLTAKDGKYYALPHYQSTAGVSYNETVFIEKNLYFADDISNSNKGFIKTADQKKSCGPDGVYNTYDDGLPSSIEEFKKLCVQMYDVGVIPFIWYGINKDYSTFLIHSLWANCSGYNGTLANVSFDSNGEEIEIIDKFNGDTPEIKKVAITNQNGYELAQQASKYYALDFASMVFSNDKYYDTRSTSSAQLHTDTQKNFLFSKFEMGQKPIGMILEGTYWENEAKDSGGLATLSTMGEIDYKVMPLPVQATGRVEEGKGKAQTAIDILNCYAFINKNAVKSDAKIDACKTFIQFCYTDESLQNFTLKSGVTKDVKYSLTTEQYNSLSVFQKSVWDIKTNGKIVQLVSDGKIFTKNSGSLVPAAIWSTVLNSQEIGVPFDSLKSGVSAKDYFLGMKTAQGENSEWWKDLVK